MEMTVGMSAPPIGMMSWIPNTSASTARIGKSSFCDGSRTSATTIPAAAARMERFTTFWPRNVMGRVGRISWSFPNAISEPVKVR